MYLLRNTFMELTRARILSINLERLHLQQLLDLMYNSQNLSLLQSPTHNLQTNTRTVPILDIVQAPIPSIDSISRLIFPRIGTIEGLRSFASWDR
jgi:hypothetical protein